jgi:hypothetical protein
MVSLCNSEEFINRLKNYLEDKDILEDLTVSFQDKWGRLHRNDLNDLTIFRDNFINDCPDLNIKEKLEKEKDRMNLNDLLRISAETDYDWEIEIIKHFLTLTLEICEREIKERKNHVKRLISKRI